MSWGYTHQNGPAVWGKEFPIAVNGRRQSPINIDTNDVTTDGCTNDLNLRYPNEITGLTIENTGHGWKVEVPEEAGKQTALTHGPFGIGHDYQLAQFHCHWGRTPTSGSEHVVNGGQYPGELHFVHWDASNYGSFAEAMQKENGLAVLAVFFDESNQKKNPELDKISAKCPDIKYKGQKTELGQSIVIDNLLPENKSFWSYEGSLTTPPLFESVTWIVFEDPIECTDEQIAAFRHLCTNEPGSADQPLVENFRPPQPLNDRKVKFYSTN